MRLRKLILFAAAAIAGVFMYTPSSPAQTQVTTIAINANPAISTTYTVPVLPGHFYQLVFAPTPAISASWVPITASNGLEYSADPPSTPNQAFFNWPDTAFTLQMQANQAGALQSGVTSCPGATVSLGAGGLVCNLYPIPARALQITTNANGGHTGTYEILLFDLTALGVNQPPVLGPPAASVGNPSANGQMLLGSLTGTRNAAAILADADLGGLVVTPGPSTSLAESGLTGQGGLRNLSSQYNFAVVTQSMLSNAGAAAGGGAGTFLRNINAFHDVTATASGNTALWTPAASKKFRIRCVSIDVTADVKAAAATDLTIGLQDSSTPIAGFDWSVFIPTTAGTTFQVPSSPMVCFANGFLSSAANNVLNVNLSAALTGGLVRVRVYGNEE